MTPPNQPLPPRHDRRGHRAAVAAALCAACLAAPRAATAAAEPSPPDPMDGWRFRAPLVAKEPAESYEVVVQHDGLAAADGRDARVVGPDGKLASLFVCSAGRTRFHIVFDGGAGAGTYWVHFGNFSPKLPAVPKGVSTFGRAGWGPKGGYSSVSYADIERRDRRKEMRSLAGVLGVYADIRKKALAAANADEKKRKNRSQRSRFLQEAVHRDSNGRLPGWFYHVYRCEFRVAKAGKYRFAIAGGGWQVQLALLLLDGRKDPPLIPGWYNDRLGLAQVTGEADLSAGTHVLDLYTTRGQPEVGIRPAGAASYRLLTARDAVYHAGPLSPGALETRSGSLAEAHLATVHEHTTSGRFADARDVCRVMRKRFAGEAALLRRVQAEFTKAARAAYDRNWMTEGKYPSRAGFVGAAAFGPPLRLAAQRSHAMPHDLPHLSSGIWTGGGLVYGLPFEIEPLPWSVTSAVCAADNVLYVGKKNCTMHAVDLARRRKVWSFTSGGPCLGCPLLYRGVLYFGCLDRRLYAVDAQRGRMLWNFPTRGWIEAGPCASGQRVFFGSRDGKLYAVDARLGVERWGTDLGGKIVAPACCDEKRVYVGTRAGAFHAVRAADGKVAWKYPAGAAIEGGACVGGGIVCFGDKSGKVHALSVATGRPAWPRPTDVGGAVLAAPIRVGAAIYGGTVDGKLFGLDAADGHVGWSAEVKGEIRRPPLFADETLVFVARYAGSYVFRMGPPLARPYPVQAAVGAIKLDGRLDEPSWKAADRLPAFVEPGGLTRGDPIDARLLWNKDTLYLGVACKGAPAAAEAAASGATIRKGESVTLLLDPRRDGLAVFELTASPKGARAEALWTAVGADPNDQRAAKAVQAFKLPATGHAWSGTWNAAAVSPAPAGAGPGWSTEIAVPLDLIPKTVAKRAGNNAQWRFNVLVIARDKAGRVRRWCLSPTGLAEPNGTLPRWPIAQFRSR